MNYWFNLGGPLATLDFTEPSPPPSSSPSLLPPTIPPQFRNKDYPTEPDRPLKNSDREKEQTTQQYNTESGSRQAEPPQIPEIPLQRPIKLPERSDQRLKILKEPQERPEEPQEGPEEPQERPEEPQERPEKPQEGPEEPQERPDEPQEKPEEPQKRPEPQERPEGPQEIPEEPQERPEEPQERPEQTGLPEEPQERSEEQTEIPEESRTIKTIEVPYKSIIPEHAVKLNESNKYDEIKSKKHKSNLPPRPVEEFTTLSYTTFQPYTVSPRYRTLPNLTLTNEKQKVTQGFKDHTNNSFQEIPSKLQLDVSIYCTLMTLKLCHVTHRYDNTIIVRSSNY